MNRLYWKFGNLILLIAVGGMSLVTGQSATAQPENGLHTDGNRILDSNGNPVIFTGINWFGLETESYAPHGLWARSLDSILDQIVDLGFNTIRLPYSNQLFDPASKPNSVNYEINPDLEGLSGLEIMDRIVSGAGERGLKIILDRHRPDSHAQSDLWYTSQYDEERWITDWVMLAERYAGDDTVIGVDLHNEPHGRATWGSDDQATDWRLAAERAGNAILEANPNLLIIVQGVEQYQGDWYWWGGNLLGAQEYPVRLEVPWRLVYSTHVYGPGVYPQAWFSAPDFPANLAGIWDRHWGYLHKEDIAPVIVGEFGGRSVGDDHEGIWQRALVSYLRENNLSYFYWTLNPNSGDTGGLLLDDWQSVDPEKEALLSQYQFPILGIEQVGPEPATRLSPPPPSPTPLPTFTPPPVKPGTLQVKYRTANPTEQSRDSKPEFVIVNTGSSPVSFDNLELYYWLDENSLDPFVYHCDWAQVGCANVLGEFGALESGTRYLRIHFPPGLEPLLPGQESGEIKVRFNHTDWSEYQQSSHYSFTPQDEYVEWERITLTLNGEVVWGTGPDSSPVSIPTNTPAQSTPAVEPAGRPTLDQISQAPTIESTPFPKATASSSIAVDDSRPRNDETLMIIILTAASTTGVLAAGLLVSRLWSRRGNK
jgi:endoglucanase